MDVRAVTTKHAAERAIQRVAAFQDVTRFTASRKLEEAVLEALRAGRVAKRLPAWAVREGNGLHRRTKATGERHLRYVWDEAHTYAALVSKSRQDGDRVWTILTVLVAPSDTVAYPATPTVQAAGGQP